MAKICILGTRGAGKTVFISVLANRYREIRDGKPYMEFKNGETNKYVARVWDRLSAEHDWPASTPIGERLLLEWGVHDCVGNEHSMCVLDAPGQDVAAIFSGEKLAPAQKILKKNISEADCIVFLVNLAEIAGAESSLDRAKYENPIVSALKDLLTRNACVAVLLSQHDRLKKYLRRGNLVWISDGEKTLKSEAADEVPIEVLKTYLPAIYKTLKARLDTKDERIYVNFVSAVADTEMKTAEDGTEREVPKANFRSYGLDEAFAWMVQCLQNAGKKKLSAWRCAEMRSAFGKLARAVAGVTAFVAICAGIAFLALKIIGNNRNGDVVDAYNAKNSEIKERIREKEIAKERKKFDKEAFRKDIETRWKERDEKAKKKLELEEEKFEHEIKQIEAAEKQIKEEEKMQIVF